MLSPGKSQVWEKDWFLQVEHMHAVPNGTEIVVQRSECPLSVGHKRRKCLIKTLINSVKSKFR